MKLSLTNQDPGKQASTCHIVGVYEDGSLSPSAKMIDMGTNKYLSNLMKKNIFSGSHGQTLSLFQVGDNAFEHVLLVGAGKPSAMSRPAFKKLIQAAIRALSPTKTTTAICYLTELQVVDQSLPWKVRQIAEATFDALYQFDQFKTKKEPRSLAHLQIKIDNKLTQKACEVALKTGIAIADGVTFTKNLANLPSNICTPTYLADTAKKLAKSYPTLALHILEEKDMKKMGMGAILGVAKGSSEDAKLICLQYKGTTKSKAPIALVGKGITFDTGGNSLKTPDSMVGMKYDMCGAATVLGTMKAAAELKLPINIVGVIPAVENMPGGNAYKPEDILVGLSGQTIEVISTDAEGRLVLSDALTYCERYSPDVVIDIATLTGAVVIALGTHATGLLANDDALAKTLIEAGEESNDRAWQMPLWDEYQDQIKSPFADMANTGGRMGGTITAACFLSRFTKKFRWAHLDVAGTAAMMMGTSERMATGRPVPMLMQYLLDRAKK